MSGEAPPKAEPSEGSTESVRREKLERLRAEGIDPFPHEGFPDRDKIATILAAHDPEQLEEGQQAGISYRIAGRLVGRRGHGKTIFLDIRDLTGSIQAYARVDAIGEEAFGRIDDLDIGDAVGGDGHVRSGAAVVKRSSSVREAAVNAHPGAGGTPTAGVSVATRFE